MLTINHITASGPELLEFSQLTLGMHPKQVLEILNDDWERYEGIETRYRLKEIWKRKMGDSVIEIHYWDYPVPAPYTTTYKSDLPVSKQTGKETT